MRPSRLLSLGALLSALLGACQKNAPAPAWPATLWDPCGRGDRYETLLGNVRPERSHFVTRWFGQALSGAPGENPPLLLGDTRDALVVTVPGRFAMQLPEQGSPRTFRAALRRQEGKGVAATTDGPVLCQVLWTQGNDTVEVASCSLPAAAGSRGWIEITGELPAAAGRVECVTRLSGQARAAVQGPEVAWASPRVTGPAPRLHPDVLLVTVDTFRADALEAAPKLRGLLARGALWTGAVAPSNWTLPSYASLFTAVDADRHGAGRAALPPRPGGNAPRDFRGVDPALPTLAQAFRAAGYATCMLHQNPFLEPWSGLDRGFERYARMSEASVPLAAAESWWRDEQHRPRFLALHLMAPHLPYAPPELAGLAPLPADPLEKLEWRAFFAGDHTPEQRREFFKLDEERRAAIKSRYYGEAAALDLRLGDWLQNLLDAEPSLILAFHSDHGEELWDDGSFEHGHSFHDSVIRVPLALVWPGHVPAATYSHPVAARDLGPTLLRAAGLPLPSSWSGDLFHPAGSIRSVSSLYRCATGGRLFTPDRGSLDLPESAAVWATGPPAELPESLRAALAALGYSSE